MSMEELFRLARTTTVAQLLERDDFAKRWAARAPISILELLYPLMQGYDSVAVRSDVELGGTDQTFNLLLARDIQRAYGQPEQAVLTMPILPGVDGVEKMSKSLGNHIGITEAPGEMYGRTLSLPDEAMDTWFTLLAVERPPAGTSARDAKHALARALVARFHGAEAAAAAAAQFERVHVQRAAPGGDRGARGGSRQRHGPPAGGDRRRLRDVALGGPADAGPGRRQARRRAAGGRGPRPAARAPGRRGATGRQAPLPPPAGELRPAGVAVHTGLLRLETAGDGAVVDLTEGVRSVVERSGVQSGVAVVFAVGATVGVTTIEYEPGAVEDLQALLDRLIPPEGEYRHNELNDDTNAHSHLRAAVIGPSETIPIVGGELGLGTWQQVVLVDFDDRPRERIVSVQVLS